ncbi:DNA polymerase/3'-5' exonuclease PolX [Candidatus Woesearchaeota archaeon]|nr:DNA polymerase/3'-5' exonuclease PolX [Candidatus Woesearchaeota archaeon]
MKNLEVAEKLNKMAELLELNEVEFKPRAYRKAAMTVEALSEDIEKIAEEDRLEELPGIGKNISQKIKDILKTGTFKAYEELKKKTPIKVDELEAIEGLGPKTVKKLYSILGVKNLKDLERAAKQGKIRGIKGLGPTVEENILKGIEFSKKGKGRVLLGFALPSAQEIVNRLKKLKEVKQISLAGSLRRRKETIGDVDILVTSSKPDKVMDSFTAMKEVADVLAKGHTKSSVRLSNGIQVDVRVLEDKSFGSALQYFTGSKSHNIHLRKIAIEKGLKLSEYGLFRGKKSVAGRTEQEIYKKLGLSYIEPELREDIGEIEAAQKGKLPKLIGYNDIKGDIHTHTNWSDGAESIETMAKAAKGLGYKYIAVTDHAGQLKIAHSLDEKRILKQINEIEKVNKKMMGFRVLTGVEVNIKDDGALDVKGSVLKKLDIVIASIHSGFKNPKEKIMKRLLTAMENGNVDVIGHPTGRKMGKREPYGIDFDRLFDKAKETNTALEINAWPERLDLNDVNVKAAVEAGVNLVIGTDAHNIDHLKFMELGIATARRGWAEAKNVLNTLSVDKLLKRLK